MRLRILLPFRVFADHQGVRQIVAETIRGSFGLLPNRLDCVAALVPGILLYETDDGVEAVVAVDAGVLVKTGADVVVSVRRAIGGTDLVALHDAVLHEFMVLDDEQIALRSVTAKLESGFLRRFASFHDE